MLLLEVSHFGLQKNGVDQQDASGRLPVYPPA